jgi:hypothetical protein
MEAMKNLKVTFALMLVALFTVLGGSKAQAQTTLDDFLVAAGNLVNVQIGSITVEDVEVITIDDVVITDVLVDVIDLDNVLNNNDIRVLTNFLNDLTIDDTLNNLLRDANIITGNQVVIGVLSSGTFLIADVSDLATNPKKTKKIK